MRFDIKISILVITVFSVVVPVLSQFRQLLLIQPAHPLLLLLNHIQFLLDHLLLQYPSHRILIQSIIIVHHRPRFIIYRLRAIFDVNASSCESLRVVGVLDFLELIHQLILH